MKVNILNTFRVMIILRQLLLLTNLHLKLLNTQGTGADKLLSTQRVSKQQQYACCRVACYTSHTSSMICPGVCCVIYIYCFVLH